MFERRRATKEELAQGQREMEDAQKRMERELEQSGELQIGDGGEPESFESPKMVREDQLGREEKLAGTQRCCNPLCRSKELLRLHRYQQPKKRLRMCQQSL